MLKHYLKIAFFNLFKHKSLSIINILGLAIAMAAGLLIFFYIQYETSYEKGWKNSKNIYRINYYRYQNGELSFKSAKALWKAVRSIRDEVPGVLAGAEIFSDVIAIYTPDNQIQDIKMYGADSNFVHVFKLDFIQKKSDNPLLDIHSSVISESAAKRLFGTVNALGKWYKVNWFWEFEVTGVYKDLPQNTHFQFDLLLSTQTYYYYFNNKNDSTLKADLERQKAPVKNWDWGSYGAYCYIVLQDNVDPARVEANINQISKKYLAPIIQNNGKAEFFLQPVRDIHLKSHFDNEMGTNSDIKSIIALSIIAVIILVIAWINFINLTLARSLERAKETGIRKITGAFRVQIIHQYLVEYSLINIISITLAFLIAAVSWSVFGAMLGKSASFSEINNPQLWLILLAFFTIGVILSGFYPALVQSSFSNLEAIKPKHKTSTKGIDLRKILVIVQFGASIVLIVGVLVVYKQISFMRNQDLGINIDRTLVTYSPMAEVGIGAPKINTYKSKLLAFPEIESVTTSSAIPGCKVLLERQDIRKPDDLPGTLRSYTYIYFDEDFINSFKLTLLEGRNFTNNGKAEATNIIINEAAVKQLGYKNAASALNSFVLVGKKQFQIIGVLKNYHQESLRKEIKPTVYFYGFKWYCDIGFFSTKISSRNVDSTINNIEKMWKQTFPKDRFEYFFLEDLFTRQYKNEQRFGQIFALSSMLAILIAALGLYGLASFSTLNRTKEIGIRKINGSTSLGIMILLSKEFTKWVIIAFILGIPLSVYIMRNWLENFAYHIGLSWFIFVSAGLIALFIAIFTISMQTWRAATRNPVEALRNE